MKAVVIVPRAEVTADPEILVEWMLRTTTDDDINSCVLRSFVLYLVYQSSDSVRNVDPEFVSISEDFTRLRRPSDASGCSGRAVSDL